MIAVVEALVRGNLLKPNVIQIGGQSIMDCDQAAVILVLDEIRSNQTEHMQIISISIGPGVRVRHSLSIGQDVECSTNALATLAAKVATQNAHLVSCLPVHHMLIDLGLIDLEAPFIVQLPLAMPWAARGAVFEAKG